MPLGTGTRLGPYEIIAPAGAGGMGEVYRARDTRLNREVAIKVLPDHLSSNPELRERFEREARAISQLSHPHICVLYDIGKHEGADYLVLEYLEGETLGARVRRGPLPTDQVLKYGAQMAEALDKAHRNGVVHRDLKPDNVMLTKSGVKLLDFGLAKPVVGGVGVASSGAATMTHSPLTTEGTLVGTFQYMSPEQLEGEEADARSDIFGLGCVLYEMVTGRRAFEGKSTAKVVAAIMTNEPPPLATLSPLTPAPLERAVKKCLAKDPEGRWQSAGDLSSELRWISESGSQSGVAIPAPLRSQRKLLRWVAVALALVAAAGILTAFLLRRPSARPTLRLAVNLPPGGSLAQNQTAVLSPDGQMMVMSLVDAEGKARLWIRRLSSDTAQPMLDTDGAINPFWSPDSQYVGFFAIDGKVRKILATGGDRSEAVTATSWSVYGGTWSQTGTILFSSGHLGLYQVSASGGTAVKVSTAGKDQTDYRWPSFLPDGKHVLVTSNSASGGIFAVSVTTGEVQPVLPGENGQAQYVEPGYLLFLRGGTLLAQPFDLRSLHVTGSAQSIDESVTFGFSALSNGMLLYQHTSQAQLTWMDPEGRKLSTVGEPGYLSSPYLSPDGRYAMVTVVPPGQKNQKLWLYDLDRGTASRFTFGDGDDLYPAWSPDSQRVAFCSTRGGAQEDIYVKPVGGGSSEQLLLGGEGNKEPDRWSADGRYIIYDNIGNKATGADVWALPTFGDRKPFPVVQTPATDFYGNLSPDGKWAAYESDESGRGEIYVVPFPGPGGKWQISTGGGVAPIWPPGNELFYQTADAKLVAVEFTTRGTDFIVGKSRLLFGGRSLASVNGIDVNRHDKRWLLAMPVGEPNASPLILSTNWTALLKH